MVIAAIFAHPDDEAFGPAGTIAQLAKEHDVYLLCATRGGAGQNHSEKETERLGKIRSEELQNSCEILGVKRVFFLGFKDGCLCNRDYHKLADKIASRLADLQPEVLLTFEPHGVSGHIDHIAVSMVTTYVFERLKSAQELWYYCVSAQYRQLMTDYYIYFPTGYRDDEVDKVVDVSDVWEQKLQAIQAHASQKEDINMFLSKTNDLPKKEYFLVLKK